MFDFIKNISPIELIIVILILLALFGSKALMGLARTSGGTVKELKKVKKEFMSAISDEEEDSKPGKKP